jgi:NAD(P)-dependent dehydrogenase (short-subunit alcohol dehydrogenase family)
MTTVLITGCSSGFGLETAKYFLERGWNVVATMRNPKADILPASERLKVLPLDVTDAESIAQCIAAAGPIDVLVNNAGVGFLNALEGTPIDTVRKIFETNTFGSMAMAQAVLPQFRARKAGVIVNVTSTVTVKPLHLLSVYTASKAAVNAFSECLALEAEPFGIRVRIVLPGRAPETSFGQNARGLMTAGFPEAYSEIAEGVFAEWARQPADEVTHSSDVAEAVWRAATDPASPMRIPAGVDAVAAMREAERVLA